MNNLKLHASGRNNHLNSLKKNYEFLKNKIIGNKELTEIEKKAELRQLKKSLNNEKNDSINNLY